MSKFTKRDLRNRMVVVLRDGTICLYVDDVLLSKKSWTSISEYDNNLCRFANKEKDIMKVYNDVWALEDIEATNDRITLWERSEVKEVTMKEVCEKFGCEVKIISEEEQ